MNVHTLRVVASPSTSISFVPPDSPFALLSEPLFSLPALQPSNIVAVIAAQRITDTNFFFIFLPPFGYLFLHRVVCPLIDSLIKTSLSSIPASHPSCGCPSNDMELLSDLLPRMPFPGYHITLRLSTYPRSVSFP